MTENDSERFTAAMALLFKNFKRQPDDDIVKINFLSLKHLTIEEVEIVITEAIMSEEVFPTLHRLRGYQSRLPLKQAPRIEYAPSKHGDDLARDAKRLIDGYMDGKLTREGMLEGFAVMEKKYPGTGWREESYSLVKGWRELDEGYAK